MIRGVIRHVGRRATFSVRGPRQPATTRRSGRYANDPARTVRSVQRRRCWPAKDLDARDLVEIDVVEAGRLLSTRGEAIRILRGVHTNAVEHDDWLSRPIKAARGPKQHARPGAHDTTRPQDAHPGDARREKLGERACCGCGDRGGIHHAHRRTEGTRNPSRAIQPPRRVDHDLHREDPILQPQCRIGALLGSGRSRHMQREQRQREPADDDPAPIPSEGRRRSIDGLVVSYR